MQNRVEVTIATVRWALFVRIFKWPNTKSLFITLLKIYLLQVAYITKDVVFCLQSLSDIWHLDNSDWATKDNLG